MGYLLNILLNDLTTLMLFPFIPARRTSYEDETMRLVTIPFLLLILSQALHYRFRTDTKPYLLFLQLRHALEIRRILSSLLLLRMQPALLYRSIYQLTPDILRTRILLLPVDAM